MQHGARASEFCFLMNVDPTDRAGFVAEFSTTTQIFTDPQPAANEAICGGRIWSGERCQ
jgi:hypothetical protein